MRTEKEIREYKEGLGKSVQKANDDHDKELITTKLYLFIIKGLTEKLEAIEWVLNENN